MPPDAFELSENANDVTAAMPPPCGSVAMAPAVSSGTMSFWLTLTRALFGPSAALVHETVIAPVRAGLPLRPTVAVAEAEPLADDGLTLIQESAAAVHPHVPAVRATLNEKLPPSPMMLCDVVLSVYVHVSAAAVVGGGVGAAGVVAAGGVVLVG